MQINNQIVNNNNNNYYQPNRSSNNTDNSFANAMNSVQNSNSNEQTTTISYINVIIPTEGTVYSGGQGNGVSFELRYAENSTEENPIMTARGWDENGDEFEQTVNINNVDPRNATIVEIRALQAHLNGGKLDLLSTVDSSVGGEGGNKGLNDKIDYIAPLKQNIEIYTKIKYPGNQEHALELSQILDQFSEFMNNKD